MAYTQALCPILQQSLADVAGFNTGYLTRQQTGFVDSIVSERNRSGFETIEISNSNGGTRFVGINFVQPASPADITNTKQSVCVGPFQEVPPFEDIVDPATMSRRYTRAFEMSEEEVSKLCFSASDQYRATLIMSRFNALLTEINADLLTTSLNLFGNSYQTGAPPFSYTPPIAPINAPIIIAATQAANAPGWVNHVERRLRQLRISGTPFVVGAGDLGIQLYADLLSYGCCNNNGIDLSRASDRMAYFYDVDADTIWGNNVFAVFAPGAFQLITHNEYGGSRKKFVPNQFENDVIIDPFTGIEFDFKMKYIDCDDKWVMSIGLIYKLWALPSNMYKNTDRMFGTRSSLLFTATTL
jgi:hypothetical protein